MAKKKARKRISGFSFKSPNGYRQGINEEDFPTRKDFLKERRDFKKAGVKIKDETTTKPFIPYRDR